MDGERILLWFSCGATSAVAAKIILEENPALPVEICYCDTSSEHPDNKRFLKDCEDWFGQSIKILKNEKYADIWDLFIKKRFIIGPRAAPCTHELKKKVRIDYQRPTDIQVFGFDASEEKRAKRFEENHPEVYPRFPLIERQLKKLDCLDIIKAAGIEIPAMYRLGFRNNNCIGCVKGQQKYWAKVRHHFPEVFERMVGIEQEIGAAINKTYAGDGKRKKLYLKDLPMDTPHEEGEDLSCGFDCGLGLEQEI